MRKAVKGAEVDRVEVGHLKERRNDGIKVVWGRRE